MENFWSNLLGVLGVLVGIAGVPAGYYYANYKNKKKREEQQKKLEWAKTKLESQLQAKHVIDARGVIQIDHGVPYYDSALMANGVDERMMCFYPIPEVHNLKKKLDNLGFKQKVNDSDSAAGKLKYVNKYNCLSEDFVFKGKFDEAFGCFGDYSWDDKTKAEVAECAKEVAQEFIDAINRGEKRFNGLMLGVKDFSINNDDIKEQPSTRIHYYISDYFTFRVFAKFYTKHYEEIKDKFMESGHLNIDVLKKLSMPFLSSFGVAMIVIGTVGTIEDSSVDELLPTDIIISGFRSSKVGVDKNKIHFGMNEAFSQMDYGKDNTPSFTACVLRGIREELLGYKKGNEKGLKYEKFIGEPYFMDLVFDSNKCEMGITGYVKLHLSPQLYKDVTLNVTRFNCPICGCSMEIKTEIFEQYGHKNPICVCGAEMRIEEKTNNEIVTDGFTLETFANLYKEAKDRDLETDGLNFTSLSNIDALFAEDEEGFLVFEKTLGEEKTKVRTKISNGYYSTLQNLKRRIDVGLI